MTVHNCVQNLANLLSSSDKQTVRYLRARSHCDIYMQRWAAGSIVTVCG